MIGNIRIGLEKKSLVLGISMVLIGILAPWVIHARNFQIYDLLYSSIENGDSGRLIIAAFKLVILNSLRALPHYLGAFIIAESIQVKVGKRMVDWIRGIVAILIIPIVYRMIDWIYGINYDLGIPAVAIILAIIYIEKLNFSTVSVLKKSIIVILLLLGVQWMDITPELSRFGFGRGEISNDVKQVAAFIESTDVLSFASILFFLIFTINGALIIKILSDEHKIILAGEANKRVERELAEARMNALEARTSQEIQSLVHDLKTPLTSIQALASVAELMEQDSKIKGYLGKIVTSVDTLNKMISEILYEDRKSVITTGELFDSILSQISTHGYGDQLIYHNEVAKKQIQANKIRLSRAMINMIENAYASINKNAGYVALNLLSVEEGICIMIEDNGTGIEEEVLNKIWSIGFSTKQSTGLGLSFSKSVIENHHGRIAVDTILGKGTKIKVILPEVM